MPSEIINGKKYDTKTAEKIGEYGYGYPRDFDHFSETLYRKNNGEFFLWGEGGPNSKYSEAISYNSWSGGEELIPLDNEEARKWCEKHVCVAVYEKLFGSVSEDDDVEYMSITLSKDAAKRIRKEAESKGCTVSKLIEDWALSL